MATIKSCTDIPQSKKLKGILPIESADMFIADVVNPKERTHSYNFYPLTTWGCNTFEELKNRENKFVHFIPCWSLAALEGLMPFHIIENNERYGFRQWKGYNSQGETYCFEYVSNIGTILYETYHWNNPLDAAFEMVVWLLENKKI